MTAHKRILGDYTITTVNNSGTVGTGNVIVEGNLVVSGNTTVIQTQSIESLDPTMLLNANANAVASYSGIEVNRLAGNTTPVLYWSEGAQAWVVGTNKNSPGTYAGILTTNTSTSGTVFSGVTNQLTYYVADGAQVGPTGANLTWNGANTFTVSGLVISSNIISNYGVGIRVGSSTPPVVPGVLTMSANISGNGGSGIYVNNNNTTNPVVDELVSKTKAKKFAIIFG